MTFDRTLYHPSVLVRLASLSTLGVAINLIAWTVAFNLLPEGALEGVFLSSRLPVAGGSEGGTLLRILTVNLLLGCGLVAAANLIRVGRFPLGYLPALAHWGLFGLILGSGSFAVERPARPPSLIALLASRGCWEILAYSIVAAATVGLFLYRQRSWLDWRTRRERTLGEVSLSSLEWGSLVLAAVLLAAANWTEARSLLSG